MTREWFTTYCQNAAANVLDRDGEVRFNYTQLKTSLDAAAKQDSDGVDRTITDLHCKISQLCGTKHGSQHTSVNDNFALVLTLLNIHAAYLMLSGLWKEEPEPTHDEYGFEIF